MCLALPHDRKDPESRCLPAAANALQGFDTLARGSPGFRGFGLGQGFLWFLLNRPELFTPKGLKGC